MSDTPKLKWDRVLKEMDAGGDPRRDPASEWPHPDYFVAAKKLKTDRESLEKLRRLSDDLETVISLQHGPGSFASVAGVPAEQLAPLHGRCWREALTNPAHGRQVWLAILKFGRALMSDCMDLGSRRTGRVFVAVAWARLTKLGMQPARNTREIVETAAERKSLLSRPYIPEFIRGCLGE